MLQPDNVDQAELLARWVDLHSDALYRFALKRIRDEHLIDDLLQDTFLAALKGHERFRGESEVRTWLVAILRLKILDVYRKRERERSLLEGMSASSQGPSQESVQAFGGGEVRLDATLPLAGQPEDSLEEAEFWQLFHRCLAKLPDKLAETFALREIDGFPTVEVCEILHITSRHLAVRLFRARSLLRDCLNKHWFEL